MNDIFERADKEPELNYGPVKKNSMVRSEIACLLAINSWDFISNQ